MTQRLGDLLDRLDTLDAGIRAEAAGAEPLERLPLRRELVALEHADPVDEDGQRSLRGHRRIELPERARGCIASVRGGLLSGCELRLVEPGKALEREVDLSADLDSRGRRRAVRSPHSQRNRVDRPEVDRDILPTLAVAASRSPDESAALVDEGHRRAVDLRLENVRDRLVGTEPLANVVGPLLQRLPRGDLLERPHGRQVLDLPEPFRGRRTDTLRRRVGCDELGVLGLERLQLVEQRVVRAVGDLGVVEDVVAVEVVLDQATQLGCAVRGRTRS